MDQRIICKSKNYLQINELCADRRIILKIEILSANRRIICRSKVNQNYPSYLNWRVTKGKQRYMRHVASNLHDFQGDMTFDIIFNPQLYQHCSPCRNWHPSIKSPPCIKRTFLGSLTLFSTHFCIHLDIAFSQFTSRIARYSYPNYIITNRWSLQLNKHWNFYIYSCSSL